MALGTHQSNVLQRIQGEQICQPTALSAITGFRPLVQGISGLGLEAQKEAVARYLNATGGKLIHELTEVETGTGASGLAKRPQLRAALDLCRRSGAILIIAKLDRLARNVYFVSGLMEARVRFVACDLPEANELTLHIMAAFAEHEAKRISQRTKEALAAAKRRGVKLGVTGPANLRRNIEERKCAADSFAGKLRGVVAGFKAAGLTQRAMVAELNQLGIRTANGNAWSLIQVQRVLARL
jgi:DNA invertase Pin-like site-specific DNA recombinase